MLQADPTPPDGLAHPIPANQLSVLQRDFQDLIQNGSLDEVKEFRDKAAGVAQYVKAARAGLELQNEVAKFKLWAERRAGEILRAMRLRGGDRVSDSACFRITLDQLGISQNQSSRWQRLAVIPEKKFAAFLASVESSGAEPTTTRLLGMVASGKRYATSGHSTDTVAGAKSHSSTNTTSPEEIIVELINHCQVLDSVLAPIYDGDGPVDLPQGDKRHLRRLVHDFMALLSDLQGLAHHK